MEFGKFKKEKRKLVKRIYDDIRQLCFNTKFFPPFILRKHNLTIFVCGKSTVNVRLKSSRFFFSLLHVADGSSDFSFSLQYQKYLLVFDAAMCFAGNIFSNLLLTSSCGQKSRTLSDRGVQWEYVSTGLMVFFFVHFFYSLVFISAFIFFEKCLLFGINVKLKSEKRLRENLNGKNQNESSCGQMEKWNFKMCQEKWCPQIICWLSETVDIELAPFFLRKSNIPIRILYGQRKYCGWNEKSST